MAITNLGGTTWLIPITVSFESDSPFHGADINFTANSISYAYLEVGDSQDSTISYGVSAQSTTEVYNAATGWIDSAYRKMSISGGADATDPYVIAWFVGKCTDITPNVVLKDENYTEQTYNGVQTVSLPNTAGGTTKYSIRPSAELEILQDGVYDTSAFGSVKVSGAGGAVITGAIDVSPIVARENMTAGDTARIYRKFTKLPNAATLPSSNGNAIAWNKQGTRVAMALNASPYIAIYDTSTYPFTKRTNPSSSNYPAGAATRCSFNPDGTRLAITHANSPYVTIYSVTPTSTSAPTKISNPNVLPGANGTACAYSHDGTKLAVAGNGSPYLYIYDTTSEPYTQLNVITSSLPTSTIWCIAWSSDDKKLAISQSSSPYFYVYDTTTTPWTRLSSPPSLPAGAGNYVAWSSDDSRLAIAHGTSPYITVYDTTTTQWTKLSNPSTLPTGIGRACIFSANDRVLIVAHNTSPYVTIYDTSTAPYTKITNPDTLPTGNGSDVAYNPTNEKVVLSHATSPYLTAYFTTDGTKPVMYKATNAVTVKGDYGYSKNTTASGQDGQAQVLFSY